MLTSVVISVVNVLKQDDVATAWGIDSSKPIVIRLHFSLSQYLDGPGEFHIACCRRKRKDDYVECKDFKR